MQDAHQQPLPLFEEQESQLTSQDVSILPIPVDVAARFMSLHGLEELDASTQMPSDLDSSHTANEVSEETPAKNGNFKNRCSVRWLESSW